MESVVAWIIAVILLLLSAVHVYWLAGGKKGVMAAIPSEGSRMKFQPTKIATGVVAGGLALAGLIALELGAVVTSSIFSERLLIYAGWILSALFILRAIGDFRWLGFFKKNKATLFAKWDTVLYSPLCLFIGLCFIYVTTS